MPLDPVPGLLSRATELLEAEFAALPTCESDEDTAGMAKVLAGVAHRLGNNYPYFHPLYAGQMLKPPHPLARAAYALAMNINPNNHARDGGRASSEMEIEAVGQIADHVRLGRVKADILATSPPAALWPIWRRFGSPANLRPASELSARSRPITPTGASPPSSSSTTPRFAADRSRPHVD